MKKILAFLLVMSLVISVASAHSGHPEHSDFEQAEAIVNVKIPCGSLSEEQLEIIGEYYMEQVHPGEAHELMDKMMGGEGSESLKQMHIHTAKVLYCGESGGMTGSGGMMVNMMGGGMMSMMDGTFGGMMGSWFGLGGLLYIAIAAFVFGIIFWWTYTLVVKDKKK